MAQQIEDVSEARYDVVLKPGSAYENGSDIINEVRLKAYCCVESNLDEDALDNIFREVRAISREDGFSEIPEEIADGLLGLAGSDRFADLPTTSLPEGIQRCDEALTDLVQSMSWHTAAIGIDARTRTRSVILEAGEKKFGKKPPSLDEEHISKWRSIFEVGQLMVLLFMGPGSGTLTLKARDDADAKPLEVTTKPGMVVILRADLLSVSHVVKGRKSYVLATFVVQDGKDSGINKTGTVSKLDEWTKDRLKELTTVDIDDLDVTIAKQFKNPTWWRSAYDHMYHSVQQSAVRGLGVRMPATWKQDVISPLFAGGLDVVTAVPFSRWDHAQYYDPEPDCWMRAKSFCKHGGFADGMELFDAKFYKIAPGEAKSMDPQQRVILEAGYESLYQAGRRQKNLLNSITGVYVASQMTEFPLIDTGPAEAGGCEQRAAGTGISGAIMSNRFSFVMGMQGPSVMVDTDASSSLTCLQLAVNSLFQGKVMATMSTSISSCIMLTPLTWMGRAATGEMTSKERCLSWDASADGWVRSDGVNSLCIDNYLDFLDGELVHDESRKAIGVISGVVIRGVGVVANLNSPSAPAAQALFYETCRQSGVALASVDVVECHADAQLLHDAVEIQTMRKCFAGGMKVGGCEGRTPVLTSGTKTHFGNAIQSAGSFGLIKQLFEQRRGFSTGMNHIRRLNPYLLQEDGEADEQPSQLLTESVAHPGSTSIVSVNGFGFGGTIGCCILTGHVDSAEGASSETIEKKLQSLPWWPAGGGQLEDGVVPTIGYDIVGSWSSWTTHERLEDKGDGLFEYTVSLGVNGFEQFRILIDGDENKVLHPGCFEGESGMPVQGPDSDSADDVGFWTIQGDPASCIGDQYRVMLQIIGKYRKITFEKIVFEKAPIELLLKDPLIMGSYFMTGEFNSWNFKDLRPGEDCTFVSVVQGPCTFLIVRNKDFNQVFHPSQEGESSIVGPRDISAVGNSRFKLPSRLRTEAFRVTFQRSWRSGSEAMSIKFDAIDDSAYQEAISAERHEEE